MCFVLNFLSYAKERNWGASDSPAPPLERESQKLVLLQDLQFPPPPPYARKKHRSTCRESDGTNFLQDFHDEAQREAPHQPSAIERLLPAPHRAQHRSSWIPTSA